MEVVAIRTTRRVSGCRVSAVSIDVVLLSLELAKKVLSVACAIGCCFLTDSFCSKLVSKITQTTSIPLRRSILSVISS